MLEIHIEKNKIIEALSIANEIAPIKQIASIVSNVHISVVDLTLTIRSTNINIGFETTIPIEKGQDGSALVLCEKLVSIVKGLPSGVIVIEQIDETVIRISSSDQKNIEYTLYLTKELYPDFASCPRDGYMLIPQKDLKSMIRKTIFAVSRDETRLNISGIFFDIDVDTLTLVGTDGRRLSRVKISKGESNAQFDTDTGMIIPIKILTLIERYASEGQIGLQLVEGRTLYIKLFDYYFSTSLISEDFPNYKRVIPENQQYLLEVNNRELSTALEQVILLSEKTKRIIFTILNNKIVINSDQAEIGKAKIEIDCVYAGPDTRIALNYSYLLEPLKTMSEFEEIIISFTENNRALSLYPKIDAAESVVQNEIHVIMPMQLD